MERVPISIGLDQGRLAESGQAHAVLQLERLVLAADRPQAHAMEGLPVAHHRTDERRGGADPAQLVLEQLRRVRIGEGADLQVQALGRSGGMGMRAVTIREYRAIDRRSCSLSIASSLR